MVYDKRLLCERILEMWSYGWSVDYIVEQVLSQGKYLLPKDYRRRIDEGADFSARFRVEFIWFLHSQGLCDVRGRSPPIPTEVVSQLIMLDQSLPFLQIIRLFKSGGIMSSHHSQMSDYMVGVALKHAANISILRTQAATWDQRNRHQLQVEECMDNLIDNGTMRDAHGRLAKDGESFENPFAKYLAEEGRQGYKNFFATESFNAFAKRVPGDSTRPSSATDRICTDPNFGFVSAINGDTGDSWLEDSDGEVIMRDNEPPWGWMSQNNRQHTPFRRATM